MKQKIKVKKTRFLKNHPMIINIQFELLSVAPSQKRHFVTFSHLAISGPTFVVYYAIFTSSGHLL